MENKEDIMRIARAFMRSRIILTAAELDLFAHIEDGRVSAEVLAAKLGLDEKALTRVLDCLAGFGLLEKEEGTYSLSDEGAFFSSRHPASSHPMLMHMNSLWDSWSSLTQVVREGAGFVRQASKPMDPETRRAFIGAMHVIGRNLSEDVAGSLDLSGFNRLLDIGGGSGTYTIAFLKCNSGLRGLLFDLPDVIPMAVERIKFEGLTDRVETVAGDFYNDALPAGCDVALLSAIIHQNSRSQNVELYSKIFKALEPGGMLIIRDHIMDEKRVWPPEGALFAINMLVNTRGGGTYTFEEVKQDLASAGFSGIDLVRSGEKMDCLVTARKS